MFYLYYMIIWNLVYYFDLKCLIRLAEIESFHSTKPTYFALGIIKQNQQVPEIEYLKWFIIILRQSVSYVLDLIPSIFWQLTLISSQWVNK